MLFEVYHFKSNLILKVIFLYFFAFNSVHGLLVMQPSSINVIQCYLYIMFTIPGLEERVYNVCGSQNFDEGLSVIQEKMEKARE